MTESFTFPADEVIMTKIHFIRNTKVMFDFDLARLYNVETKTLKQAVRRNMNRFPKDFMFELTKEEFQTLRSQIVTSKLSSTRYMPMAFSEHGVLMLSSVLKNQRAIDINIHIVRIFLKMRKLLLNQKKLWKRLHKIESNLNNQSDEIKIVFEYLKKLMQKAEQERNQETRKRIGFK